MSFKKTTAPTFLLAAFLNIKTGYCAVAQILNDSFFQNPAELNVINKSQIMVGNIFINPVFNFSGSSYGANGSVESSVNDYLPYLLTWTLAFFDGYALAA